MPSALRRYRRPKVSSAVTGSRASASSKAASASKARCRPVKATRRSAFKFDFDLFGTGDNAGQTTFRLQNAYGEWGSLLAGQTDSLFMDIDVFPNTIDYWGPPGMVFYRNVQIRWTPFRTDNSHFAIAIERPGNDIDGGQRPPDRGLRGRRDPERRGAARSHRAVAHRRRLGAFPGRRDPAQGRV